MARVAMRASIGRDPESGLSGFPRSMAALAATGPATIAIAIRVPGDRLNNHERIRTPTRHHGRACDEADAVDCTLSSVLSRRSATGDRRAGDGPASPLGGVAAVMEPGVV